jgi:hypothetical protein
MLAQKPPVPTWNEVQRQVHEIPNDLCQAKLPERRLERPSESLDGVAARLQLPPLSKDSRTAARNEGAVERVQDRVFQDVVPREQARDGGAFAEDEQSCGEDGQGSVHKGHDGELGDVGEKKHGPQHAGVESEIGDDLGPERPR